ncbi:MAG: twin-arginine translocation signal domain-containing protein, partial [Ginsengibacter sp.]
MNINRRKFVARSAVSAAGMLFGSHLKGMPAPISYADTNVPSAKAKYDLMKDVMKYRKIDTHAHIYFTDDSPGEQLDFGERLGIGKQVISRYLSVMPGTPEQFREYNDLTIKAIKKYPDHLLG